MRVLGLTKSIHSQAVGPGPPWPRPGPPDPIWEPGPSFPSVQRAGGSCSEPPLSHFRLTPQLAFRLILTTLTL